MMKNKDTAESHSREAYDETFCYRMLGRLKSNCEYFLGNDCRYEPHLWAGSVDAHIAEMRKYYMLVPEKPVWLTETNIDLYERDMKGDYRPGDILRIGVSDDDVPEYRVIKTVKTAWNERNQPITMYGFDAYWDRELQRLKYSNTSRLPEGKQIRIIGQCPIE